MNGLLAAIRFLTILPLPGRRGTAETDLARSVAFFPLVGILLGAAAALVAWCASLAAPPLLASAVLIVVLLGFSGGLHLDGLSDSADGLLSARPKEKTLEIMRDSRVGAMGVMAIVCVLLVKFASLASVSQEHFWRTALLMPLAGRSVMVVQMALLAYVRPNGLAQVFCGRRPYWAALQAVVILALAGWLVLGIAGLVIAGVCLALTLGLAAYYRCRIGGATGDTFGATCEIIETVPAFVMAVWPLHVAM